MSIFVQKTRVFEVFHGKYFFPFFVFNKVKMVYLINGILKLLEQIYIYVGVYMYLVIANKIRFNIFFYFYLRCIHTLALKGILSLNLVSLPLYESVLLKYWME